MAAVTPDPAEHLDRRDRYEQRLARARRIDAIITAACSGPIFDGLTLAQVDQDGTLQDSVRALVTSVGSARGGLDVVVYRGPHSPWGLRVVVEGDTVQILPVTVGGTGQVVQDDGQTPDLSRAAELAAMMWRDR